MAKDDYEPRFGDGREELWEAWMAKHTDEKGRSVSARSKVAKGMRSKVHKVMKEFKEGELHSGSKKGPKVKSRKQAIAIALSEARRGK